MSLQMQINPLSFFLPSIKELSKVLPTNPALDSYHSVSQDLMIYCWDGEKDLHCYTLDTEEKRKEFKRLRLLKEKNNSLELLMKD